MITVFDKLARFLKEEVDDPEVKLKDLIAKKHFALESNPQMCYHQSLTILSVEGIQIPFTLFSIAGQLVCVHGLDDFYLSETKNGKPFWVETPSRLRKTYCFKVFQA